MVYGVFKIGANKYLSKGTNDHDKLLKLLNKDRKDYWLEETGWLSNGNIYFSLREKLKDLKIPW